MAESRPPTALETLVRQGSDEDLRRFLLLLQPPEIADLIEALDEGDDRARAFRAIVGRKQPSVLREISEPERDDLLEDLEPHETAQIVAELKSDDAADVLQDLDEDEQEEVLKHVSPEDRAELRGILRYPEESAGGIMQTELVRVQADGTVKQARDVIRRTRDEVGELHEIFVVDEHEHLLGWVKERALILASDDDRIRSVVTPVPKRVPVSMDQEEIANLVKDYDLSSVPVVDELDRLVGRILVDDIIDVVTEEATEDITRMGGTDPEEIYEPSVRQALRSRTPWLVLAFIGLVAASVVIAAGEEIVMRAGTLFAFIPVIMGMGGGSSTQAATVTVRSLALGHIRPGQIWEVVRKELLTALLIALGVGLVLAAVVTVMGQPSQIALIAAVAVFGTITLGAALGVLTPILLDRLGVDPAVATSPFVTTMNDIVGSTMIIVAAVLLL